MPMSCKLVNPRSNKSKKNILLPIEWVWRGESMVKYTKKIDEKISHLKRGSF